MTSEQEKHSFTYSQQISINPKLAQQLLVQKNLFKEQINRVQQYKSNSSIQQVYIISTKFLEEWKNFVRYQEQSSTIDSIPKKSKVPSLKNQNIVTKNLNFQQVELEQNLKEGQNFIFANKKIDQIFSKYKGVSISRKIFRVNGKPQIQIYPIKAWICFISFNTFSIAYKNPNNTVPTYDYFAYKYQTVQQFLKRVGKYSQQEKNNNSYENIRLWKPKIQINLDKYFSQIKSAVKNNKDESGIPYLKPLGEQIDQKILIGDLKIGNTMLIVQLKNVGKEWVYRDVQNKSNNSIQNKIQNQDNKFKQQNKQSSEKVEELKKCAHCEKFFKNLFLKCQKCQQAFYCSAICKESHQKFHKATCSRNFNQTQMKKDNDYLVQPAAAAASAPGHPMFSSFKQQPPFYDNSKKYQKIDKKIQFKMTTGSRKGVVGLQNIGNTCYMNSALQCLSHTLDLTNYFIDKKYQNQINEKNPIGSGGKFVKQYARLLQNLWAGTYQIYKPEQFKDTLGETNIMFEGYMQHDSQQFLSYTLDIIHQDLNRVKQKPMTQPIQSGGRPDQIVGRDSWFNYLKRNQSIIIDLFAGQFKSRVTCPNCNLNSLTFDPYSYIPLPMPEEGKQQIILYFFYQNYKSQTQKITIVCKTNQVNQILQTLQKATKVPVQRIKLVVSGWNGMIREVKAEDTIKRLINEKHLSQRAQQKQLFACQYSKQEMQGDKTFLVFKFVNQKGKAITFKRIVPFKVDNNLKGSHLYDRIAKLICKVINPPISENQLRELTKKSQGFKINAKYGSMKVQKNQVSFKNQQQIVEDTNIFKYFNISRGQIEFQVTIFTNEKLNFNMYKPLKEDDHNPKFKAKTCFTLDQCLKHFSLTEILQEGNQWYCPNCKDRVIAQKQMQIFRCPRYLIFQIKRFKDKMHQKIKNDTKVDFPLQLDMKPYTMDYSLPETYYLHKQSSDFIQVPEYYKNIKVNESKSCKYQLYGIVNHYGSLQGGHYTSTTKNNGKWYKFNDAHVTQVSESQIVESSAYLLFYKLIDQ